MSREQAPFPVVRLRGYDIGQVNAFLRAAIAERRRLAAENDQLREQVAAKSQELAVASSRAVTPASPISADHAASILAAAQRTAELTVAEARHQAAETLRAAVERAEALAATSERQLAVTRDELNAAQARLIGLQALENEYRGRLRAWAAGVLVELDDGAPAPGPGYAGPFAEGVNTTAPMTMRIDVDRGTVSVDDETEADAGRGLRFGSDAPASPAGSADIPASVVGAATIAPTPREALDWFAPVGSPHRPTGL